MRPLWHATSLFTETDEHLMNIGEAMTAAMQEQKRKDVDATWWEYSTVTNGLVWRDPHHYQDAEAIVSAVTLDRLKALDDASRP